MILKTPRTILRAAETTDTAFVMELLNSKTWLQHIGDRKVNNTATAHRYITENFQHHYSRHGFGLYVICLASDAQPIGINGFVQRPYLPHPDLGFALLPAYTSKGYIFETSTALLEYGYHTLQFEKIMAITTPANHRSKATLRRLNFQEIKNNPLPDAESKMLLFEHHR